jgi:class 3 adenylate cyclase/tetratricopeptide (TPR) repeat protein
MADIVTNWLEQLGLGQYADVFVENAIAWEHLPDLDHETLLAIGVKAVGHRITILKAVAALPEGQPDASIGGSTIVESDDSLAAWEMHPDERKPATVLFADITGSTALTENLDAEETHDILDGARRRMCGAVANNRGTVCRVMGDGVMAVFGAPVASEQHAVEACEAALEMQQAIRDYAGEIETRYGDGFKIRVGLHSGEIVVLTSGEGDKVKYDADGPTVPIAARMEQSAEPGAVYITAATQSLAENRIETDALTPISIKGISDPVPVFSLLRVRSIHELPSDAARTSFVGRGAELNQFKGMLDACIEEGHGQTIYVRGEPGIGKTRLIEEFTKIAEVKGTLGLRGLVLPFGVGKGQDAIHDLVRGLLEIPPGSEKNERQRAAETAISDGRLEPEQAVFLNDLLDLPQPTELRIVYDAMDNSLRNAGKQRVVSTLVTAVSNTRSTLVIVEDVHWAGALVLAHLSTLAKTVAECPALLVMTSRIEGDQLDQSWRSTTAGSPFVSIDLGPLRERDAIALIEEFIDTSDALAESCLERAAGNPLFLEQLLRNAEEGTTGSLPDSIQSLVLARMDRLAPDDKKALQAASIIGQRFHAEVICDLLSSEGYDCRELVAHNLVRPEGNGFLFTHALIQESVYSSLVKSQRRELHRKAAQWFADSDLVLRAEHLARAGDPAAAGAYLNAARQEMSLYRYDRARQLIEEGIELATDDSRFDLTCLRGELLHDMVLIEESLESYRTALSMATSDVERCRVWIGTAAGLRLRDECSEALELLDRSEAVAQAHGLWFELTRIQHLMGNLHWRLENHEDCRSCHEKALDFAKKAGSIEYQALAYGGLGDAHLNAGRMKTAHAYYKRCIDLCRENGLGRIQVAHRSVLGDALRYLGDEKGCHDECLAGAEMAEKVGHIRAEILARQSVCMSAVILGDPKQAREQLERAKALASKHGLKQQEKDNVTYEGCVLACEGRRQEALDILRKAVSSPWNLAYAIPLIDDPVELMEAMVKGEVMMQAQGSCYDYLEFYPAAIDGSLRLAEWEQAERYAAALSDYTRDEPLPSADFFIARGRALAAFGRGKRDNPTMRELKCLRDEAERIGVMGAIPALDKALSST